jgi:hypothetical protein
MRVLQLQIQAPALALHIQMRQDQLSLDLQEPQTALMQRALVTSPTLNLQVQHLLMAVLVHIQRIRATPEALVAAVELVQAITSMVAVAVGPAVHQAITELLLLPPISQVEVHLLSQVVQPM